MGDARAAGRDLQDLRTLWEATARSAEADLRERPLLVEARLGNVLTGHHPGVEYHFDFDGGPEDVSVKTSGVASQSGFVGMIGELTRHERFRAGMTILVDHTDLDLGVLTNEDVHAIAQMTKAVADQLQSGLLVVVTPTMLGFALSRMWQTLVDDLAIDTKVAASRSEAESWILDTRPPRPAQSP